MIDNTAATFKGFIKIGLEKLHQALGSSLLSIVGGIVIVDLDKNSRAPFANPNRRLHRDVDLTSSWPSLGGKLRHCQRRHPPMLSIKSEVLPPGSPRIHRCQRSTNSISFS